MSITQPQKIGSDDSYPAVNSAAIGDVPTGIGTSDPRAVAPRSLARMPDFFIIGAMKAGTTTLFRHLNDFPAIGMAQMKETDYFITDQRRPRDLYAYGRAFEANRPICGEASPNYTKHDIFPGVPGRIARHAPEAKFIFIARDPVDRFASHYRHSWLHGHMSVAPADLLESDNGQHMLECSRYYAQIKKYLAHFHISKFMFLDFQSLCDRPQITVDRVADFLQTRRQPLVNARGANSAKDIAKIPAIAQRIWRTPTGRKIAPYVPVRSRDVAKKILSIGNARKAPELDDAILSAVAQNLREDATRFRELTGLEPAQWRV